MKRTEVYLLAALAVCAISGCAQAISLKQQQKSTKNGEESGTRWALLIAGSKGYENYRHQADVCHAYQLLKKGGLKDENIVVMMYDDIAYNKENPHRGVIINSPKGENVYVGVLKDYTGEHVHAKNFLNVLLGNAKNLTGGSGKVINSGPNDEVFVYFADHGGPGVLGMPDDFEFLVAKDLIDTLKKKHAQGGFKQLLFYVEACESGSIFDGLLPDNINIFATTAADGTESSFAFYCPGDVISPPPEYYTCLGDEYSINWMEDTEKNNRHTETLEKQYEDVKSETHKSDVQEFGDVRLSAKDHLDLFMGVDTKQKGSPVERNETMQVNRRRGSVEQREADLVFFKRKVQKARKGSEEHLRAQRELAEVLARRSHIEESFAKIGNLLFGSMKNGLDLMKAVRPAGQALVDDWDCFKAMIGAFQRHCGSLTQYGMKHTRLFANACNAGLNATHLAEAAAKVCTNTVNNV